MSGRGNLLAGIQGFKKSGLEKTETVDKSAPPVAGGGGAGSGAARPGGGGGGPFGIPAGGIAGLKKTPASTIQTPSGGPPMPGSGMLY
jgi:hypothetical protein